MKRICWAIITLVVFTTGLASGQVSFEEQLFESSLFAISEARGVSVADIDNDGDEDFFIAGNDSRLYINSGDFQFSDATNQAGLSGIGSRTAVWVDLDNDGFLDLVASSWKEARVYMNNADGSFRAGKEIPLRKRNLLMAGDLNGDGWVDIFSSNFRNASELLINDGLGGFVDMARPGGVDVNSNGMGGLLIDIDQDADLDIYVTFDGDLPGRLFVNDGTGLFTEEAAAYGLNLPAQAMGVDLSDFNGDGEMDFYVTNLEDNFLFIRKADGTFSEVAEQSGVNDTGMGWGVRCADFDNDGRSDIYINNEYDYSPFENRLYRNLGDMRFADIASGTALANFESGYGTTSADLNNDGWLDLIVVNDNPDRAVRIFKNEGASQHHWFECNLVGVNTNKYAVGARVEAYAEGNVWIDQVTAGSGWASQQGYRLHFGLGEHPLLDSLVVYWPDGNKDVWLNLFADRRMQLVQGASPVAFSVDTWAQAQREPGLLPFPVVARPLLPDPNFSIARQWNELLLTAIRTDFARPTVHARNLFHLSAAMYDAWAAFGGNTFLLGKRFDGFEIPFEGIMAPEDVEAARNEAISYAAYRLLKHRFRNSPGAGLVLPLFDELMARNGYATTFSGINYALGNPAALGNYIGESIIAFGYQDGANEFDEYKNLFYEPVNDPLRPLEPGNEGINNPNRWQPLEFDLFIDQSGNVSSSTPDFLGAEWGRVTPFALPGVEKTIKERDGNTYEIYLDPGPPPMISDVPGLDDPYKWHHTMVAIWGSHLDYSDGVLIDISPKSNGNNPILPTSLEEQREFYDYYNGGDKSNGYDINPFTGDAYQEQLVPRADFARVLAEFWADGPDSETPPGHWFTLMNYVHDHPLFERKWQGEGAELPELEWDVKAYLTLGGAMHDAAVAAWGIKGYYDYIRPISAIRYMAERGQSSDANLPNYHEHGIPLINGFVELVKAEDPLAGPGNQNVGEIKLYSWRGHENYNQDFVAGVEWILAREWISYQRATFVTPPFAGYVSGHSTFSRAAADVLSNITGSEYFPGGMGEFVARKNDFLVFERGPSVDVRLQWARYRDAADQSALSRIWGGIHPPADDLPGRIIGEEVASLAFEKAMQIFTGNVVTDIEPVVVTPMRLYPNPARAGDYITVLTTSGVRIIRILDISGRIIHQSNVDSSGKSQIRIPAMRPGLYLVEVMGDRWSDVQKLVIR